MATTYKATWIWYPGDYEIWLGNKMNNRRTDRGAYFPPFWKQDSHYVTVEFSKAVDLTEDEELKIEAEGSYNIKIDGKMLFGMPKEVQDALAAGVPFPSRLGTPDDYAKLACHIVENDMLNGEVIRLDGAIRLAPK